MRRQLATRKAPLHGRRPSAPSSGTLRLLPPSVLLEGLNVFGCSGSRTLCFSLELNIRELRREAQKLAAGAERGCAVHGT